MMAISEARMQPYVERMALFSVDLSMTRALSFLPLRLEAFLFEGSNKDIGL